MLQQESRSGLTHQVYEHIKQALLDGVYRPGEPVVIEKISAELHVSRQPVMDAVKRLSMEGFLTILPQIGCRVRTYQPQEVLDFFHMVAPGEALIAELAAKRAKPDEVVTLRIISAQIGNITKTRKGAAEKGGLYRVLNRQLHRAIGTIARSAPVAEIVSSLGDRSDFFIASAERPIFYERLQQAHKEHEMIIAAIEENDWQTASRVMRGHILAIEKRLREPNMESVS